MLAFINAVPTDVMLASLAIDGLLFIWAFERIQRKFNQLQADKRRRLLDDDCPF